MKYKFLSLLLLLTLVNNFISIAQEHYHFNPADYVSTDNSRAPQSAFIYNQDSFTIKASGQNNVAFKMGEECDSKYFIKADEHWLVIIGTELQTSNGDARLWWINGTNYGSQVSPDYTINTSTGQQAFVWDLRNGNELFSWFCTGDEQYILDSKGTGFILSLGLTTSSSAGTVNDIGYYSDITVSVTYPELMSTLGINHKKLQQDIGSKLSDLTEKANLLLVQRPATEEAKKRLQAVIDEAQTAYSSITADNYLFVCEIIEKLEQAIMAYKKETTLSRCIPTESGLLAYWDDIIIRVGFLNDSTLRITKVMEDESKIEKSLVVKSTDTAQVTINHTQEDSVMTLTTEKVRLTYNLNNAVISVYRPTGELLIKELQTDITPYSDGTTPSHRLSQVFKLSEDEKIYGLGQLQNGQLSMRGVRTTMIQNNRSIYIPYFYSSKRYGIYWDNYSPTVFNDNNMRTTFQSTGQSIDYYVLVGENADGVLRSWRHLTGGTQLPPLWNFGLYQSKQRYMSAQEVIDVVAKYRELGVPLDCIVQDWQYWGDDDHWNAMEFLNPMYKDYQRMIDEVHSMHAKLMISVWPDFGPKTLQYNEFGESGRLIPIQSYPNWVATRPYDCYDTSTRNRYWNYLYNGLMNKGVDALWLDSSEPDDFSNKGSDYDYITGLDGRTFRSLRNAYPLCHVEGVYDNHRKESNLSDKRVSILTRSGFAGMQRTGAFVWSADITSSWETLAAQIPAACNLSVSGLPYWNSDTGAFFIGGYVGGVNNPEWRALYQRWTQFSCFCPMMRFHGDQTPREIWQFGKSGDAQGDYDNILRYIRLRYSLLPYIYSTAHQVVDDEDTFMRSMPIAFEDDSQCEDVSDQYMFGRSFLVAPVVNEGISRRDVYLPSGKLWYDFWTGQIYQGGKTITKCTPQDIIPLYIPSGSILPIGPAVQYSTEKKWDDLEIRVYAGSDGRFTLYEDEFDGYGYQQGSYTEIPFTWDEATQTLTIGERKGEYPGMLKQRTFRIVRVSSEKGYGDRPSSVYDKTVSYNGNPLTITFAKTNEVESIVEDMTEHIKNPSFESDGRILTRREPQGWTVESDTEWWGVNIGNGDGDPKSTDGLYIFGVWDKSSTKSPRIVQTINSLPSGYYELTVDMHASNRSATTIRLGRQYVFAGSQKGYFSDQLSTAGIGDTYPMQTIKVRFEQKEDYHPINIGVCTEGAPSETWFKIDNFHLYRLRANIETGLSALCPTEGTESSPAIYDLSGRRIHESNLKPHKIYIKNRKKYIFN